MADHNWYRGLIGELEPRMMFDGAAVSTAVAVLSDPAASDPAQQMTTDQADSADSSHPLVDAISQAAPSTDSPGTSTPTGTTPTNTNDSGSQPADPVSQTTETTLSTDASTAVSLAASQSDTQQPTTDMQSETKLTDTTPSSNLSSEILLPITPSTGHEVVFIDSGLKDYQTMLSSISSSAEIYVVDNSKDGWDFIAQTLNGQSDISAVHILGHGSSGSAILGTTALNAETLESHSADLATIGSALTKDGDILLYGCDIASGEKGAEFLGSVADLTGADIAASTDKTGAASLGGNWVLETSTGTIETANLSPNYSHLLDTDANQVFDFGSVSGGSGSSSYLYCSLAGSGTGTVEINANDVDFSAGERDAVYFKDANDSSETFLGYLQGDDSIDWTTYFYNVSFNTPGEAYIRIYGEVDGWVYRVNSSTFTTTGNAAPTFTSSSSASVNEDSSVSLTISGQDGGILNDNVYLTLTSGPSHGSVSGLSDGWKGTSFSNSYTYTPTANFYGTDYISFSLYDGTDYVYQTVTVTVHNINDAPVLNNGSASVSISTEEDTNYSGSPLSVSDIDSNSFTYSVTGSASHGTASVNSSTGALSYIPSSNYNGNDSFTVQVSDGSGGTDSITVNVTVNPINDAPILNSGATSVAIAVDEDASYGDSPLTVADVDSSVFSYSLTGAASHGTASIDSSSGAITYHPAANYYGSDSFTVQVSDGSGGTDSITVSVTVNAVNDAPVLSAIDALSYSDTINLDDFSVKTGLIAATDIDSSGLTYSIVGTGVTGDSLTDILQGTYGILSLAKATGGYTYTPNDTAINSIPAGSSPTDTFTLSVSDGQLTDSKNLVITLNGSNDSPIFGELQGSSANSGTTTIPDGGTPTNAGIEVLNNGALKFGNGSIDSVNASSGMLEQPWYYDNGTWYKLTFSSYRLNFAIAAEGDGTNEWNLNGTVNMSPSFSNATVDNSGYSTTGHYGTITYTGYITLGSTDLKVAQVYDLASNGSYIKATTQVTNVDTSTASNLRVWVGTQDDWIALTDAPAKLKGNLVNGEFSAITSAEQKAAALKVYSGDTAVLFYSTSDKANTITYWHYSWSGVINTNPQQSVYNQPYDDGAYGMFVRMNDLAPGQSESFDWYYAAGAIENINSIISIVAQAAAVGLPEGNTGLTSTGTYTVSDIDAGDIVNVELASVTAAQQDMAGNSLTASSLQPSNSSLLSMMSLSAQPVVDSAHTEGTLSWTFDSGNEAFDYLASGERLVLTYSLRAIDTNGATTSQTVEVTINGTNDAPTFAVGNSDTASAALTETNSVLSTSGTLTVHDLDQSNTVAPQVYAISKSGTTAGLSSTNSQLLAMLSVDNGNVISASETEGELHWSFNSGNQYFDYLAAGETLTLAYTIRVNDSSSTSGYADTVVTVVVTGTNDSPVVSVLSQDSASAGLTETNSALTASGSFHVQDLDYSNTVSASVHSVNLSGSTIGLASSLTAIQSMLSLSPATVIGSTATSGSLNWSFNSGTESFDHLAHGETMTIQFIIRLADSANPSAYDEHTVSITISATNDAPVITVEAGDSISKDVTETDASLSVSGTLHVTDMDTTDIIRATTTVTAQQQDRQGNATASNVLQPSLSDLLAMFAVTSEPIDATSQHGTLHWDFNSGADGLNQTFNYLGDSEKLVLTYTITTTDPQVASDSQTVTITITGTNDAPKLIVQQPVLETITEDATVNSGQLVSSFLRSSDPDPNPLSGIAIYAANNSNGIWQYSIDNGVSWVNFGSVSSSSALLLASNDRVRFVPDTRNSDSPTFSFRAWDQFSGTAGTKADLTTNGQTSPFSSETGTASLTVTAVNDPLTVSGSVPGQHTGSGFPWSYSLPSNLFSDIDIGDRFTYSLSGLPQGLQFNPGNLTISGIPTEAGSFTITLTGRDNGGAAATITFALVVDPEIPTISPQTAGPAAPPSFQGSSFSTGPGLISIDSSLGDSSRTQESTIGQQTIFGAENISSNESSGSNPSTLFNMPFDQTENSRPQSSIVTSQSIAVTTTGNIIFDSDNSQKTTEGLFVERMDMNSMSFTIQVADTAGIALNTVFSATLKDGTQLPAWMNIDPNTGVIQGVPPENLKEIELEIISTDSAGNTKVLHLKVDFSQNQQEADLSAWKSETQPGYLLLNEQLESFTAFENYGTRLLDALTTI